MSTRTIIEVNHDYIEQMKDEAHISHALYRRIMEFYTGHPNKVLPGTFPGIRILGSRHHSETLNLKVE